MVNFNPMDLGTLSGEKVDIVNTKESVLPVCNKPYHTNTRIVQKGEEIVVVGNYA